MGYRPAIERLTRVYVSGGLGERADAAMARSWGRKLNEAARNPTPEI